MVDIPVRRVRQRASSSFRRPSPAQKGHGRIILRRPLWVSRGDHRMSDCRLPVRSPLSIIRPRRPRPLLCLAGHLPYTMRPHRPSLLESKAIRTPIRAGGLDAAPLQQLTDRLHLFLMVRDESAKAAQEAEKRRCCRMRYRRNRLGSLCLDAKQMSSRWLGRCHRKLRPSVLAVTLTRTIQPIPLVLAIGRRSCRG